MTKKLKVRRYRLLIVALLCTVASNSFAVEQTSPSGPILDSPTYAVRAITTSDSGYEKEYAQLESEVMKSISNGPRLLSIIGDFDYEVAEAATHQVHRQARVATKINGLVLGDVKNSLPGWALPIFEYTDGIPSGWILENVGIKQPYEKINSELRDPARDSEATIKWVSQMRESLSHLPRFEGISFRGARLPKTQADQYYQLGKIAKDEAFVSTSMSVKVAARFAFPIENLSAEEYRKLNLLFIVIGHTGRPVSFLADDHHDEAEILFANGTKFRVVAKSNLFRVPEGRSQTQIIVLRES